MSRQQVKDLIRFQQGFYLTRPTLDIGAEYAAEGSANVLFSGQGKGEPFKGLTSTTGIGGSQMFQASDGYASLGAKAVPGKGSVYSYIGRSIWFIGVGELLFNGAVLTGAPAATTSLRFRLFESGAYNGTTLTAGLAAPGAPTVVIGPAGTKNNGTYSTRLSAVRSTTGAESNASISSGTVSLSNQKLAINFPAAVGNGQDKWGVYVTRANFGDKGPHYGLPTSLTGESPAGFVKETTVAAATVSLTAITNANPCVITAVANGFITGQTVTIAGATGTLGTAINGARVITVLTADTFSIPVDTSASSAYAGGATAAGRTLYFQWLDGDLISGELAPIENNVPPVGTHAFVLEGCSAIVGAYGDSVSGVTTGAPGNMIAASKAGYPEAFPADAAHLLALPEPPTLVLPRAANGFVYIAGANSLSMVRYTGAITKAPLSLTVLWPDVGFKTFTNATTADGQLYGYAGVRGPVRIDGDGNPDYRFASGISSLFDGIDASNVVVGYDPASTMVVYAWTDGAVNRLVCFNKAYEVWSTPIQLESLISVPPAPGVVKEMVTVGNALYLIIDTGAANYVRYQFNVGSGSTWKLRSAWRDAGYPEKNKTISSVKLATTNDTSNTMTVSVYKNLNGTTPDFTKSYTPKGTAEHVLRRTNVRNAKTYAIHLQGTDNNTMGLEALVEGTMSEVDT